MPSRDGHYTVFWHELEMTDDYGNIVPFIDELLDRTDSNETGGAFVTTWTFDKCNYKVEWNACIAGLQMELFPLI